MILKIVAGDRTMLFDHIEEISHRREQEVDFLDDQFRPKLLVLSNDWEERFREDQTGGRINLISAGFHRGANVQFATQGECYVLNDEGTTIEVIRGVDDMHGSVCDVFSHRDLAPHPDYKHHHIHH